MISSYVSFKNVINKLYRDLGVNSELNEAEIIEWCSEVLSKVGSYYQYNEYKDCLELTNGKCKLPNNFDKIVDVTFNSKSISWASNTMYNQYTCNGCKIPSCCTQHTMYINDSYIITNITDKECITTNSKSLCIIYLGIAVDSEGYPLIPDDIYFMEACAKYVTYMLDYQEWRKGNIPDKVLNKSETDYLFYINSARGSANMPNGQQLENIKNSWVRLIPRQNLAKNNYDGLTDPENLIRH